MLLDRGLLQLSRAPQGRAVVHMNAVYIVACIVSGQTA